MRHPGAHAKASNLKEVTSRLIEFICTPTSLTMAAVTCLKQMVSIDLGDGEKTVILTLTDSLLTG